MYEYRANVIRVVDGDTLHVDVDLGCDCHTMLTLRLDGVNAPEHGTPEGEAATAYVENWVHDHAGSGGAVVVQTVKDRREKFGRYLATVLGWSEAVDASERDTLGVVPTRNLNTMLVENGHAVEYHGGKR
jgi:micrococcal nuclease